MPRSRFLPALLVLSALACAAPGKDETPAPPTPEPTPSATASPSPGVPAKGALAGDLEVEVRSLDAGSGPASVVMLAPPDGSFVLPIEIGPAEALAIAVGLHEVDSPRPLTHDLMRDLLAATGSTVRSVRVAAIRDGTFLATLKLHAADADIDIDCRPSDAIALALRTDSPIFVSDAVVAAAAIRRPPGPGILARGLAGITLQPLTPGLVKSFALATSAGVLVSQVDADSPAGKAGLAAGDVVLAVDGKATASPEEFSTACEKVVGPLRLSVLRRGETRTIELASR